MQLHTVLRSLAIFFITLLFLGCAHTSNNFDLSLDTYSQYSPVELTFDGPHVDELDELNPFLNYRMDVIFTHKNKRYVVPGFFAADGHAAHTSATSGNKWRVRFSPPELGIWRYSVRFLKGEKIAISKDLNTGKAVEGIHNLKGSFNVTPSPQTSAYARGRLEYIGGHYLQFSQSKSFFIKTGVDSPENFLAYDAFDATTNVANRRKSWQPHLQDYNKNASRHLWKDEKGKEILGVINYLKQEGLNSFSFLTFNIDGDDRNVFPHILKQGMLDKYERYAKPRKNTKAWNTFFHTTRFDVSKLAQWNKVLTYGTELGFFLHFKTHEIETDHIMDNGEFSDENKVYYRELIARFSHHTALNWNIGEENKQTTSHQRAVATYIRDTSPYKKQHIVMHTYPNRDDLYTPLLGDKSNLTGASLQLRDPEFKDVYPRVRKWYQLSQLSGKPWAIAVDEPGNGDYALLTDSEDPEHNIPRGRVLWGTLFGGGYGVEWYFGYKSPESDLTAQDFRSRGLFWKQNLIARHFMQTHIPFTKMKPLDSSLVMDGVWVFGIPEEIYAIYMPKTSKITNDLRLDSSSNTYSLHWYNPRTGGELRKGQIEVVEGKNGVFALGRPPSDPKKDWVALLKKIR